MNLKKSGLPKELDTSNSCRLYEDIEYREFWNENAKHNLDLLEHAIVSSLIPASGYRIIDIGCGFGRLAECYLDRFEQVIMLDGSMTLLQQAQEAVGKRAIYIAADVNHLPLGPSSVDCALMIRVFHHLQDSQIILNETQRILRRKGVFIFNYCNKINLRQLMLWILRFNRKNPLTLEPAGLGTLFISHHPKSIQLLLKKNGYKGMQYFGSGVFDKIPDASGRLLFLAKFLAPVFGFTNLAPWINCRAVASSGCTLDTKNKVEDIFICPSCHGDLIHLPNVYTCKSCGGSYPIEDGIIDFRLDANGDI